MTTLTLATLLVTQSATPATVLSTMNRYYAVTQKMSAQVTLVQRMGEKTATIKSRLQFDRPGKFYLHQDMVGVDAEAVVIADGTHVAYTPPRTLSQVSSRLVYETQRTLTVNDVYALSTNSLIDRSPLLDIMVCKPEHIRYVIGQLATMKLDEKTEQGDHVVTGDWRSHSGSVPVGTYRMVISPAGELKRYERRERIQPPGTSTPLTIVSTWTAQQNRGVIDNPALFKVR